MGDTDDIFLKRFSLVIAALVAITIVILIIASNMTPDVDPASNPSRTALANDRTLPVGAVRTAVTEADLAQAVAAAPAVAAEPVSTASIDGAAVYASACQACHLAGAAGAPIPGSDLWAERAEKGLEQLAYNAINGINAMPAKGGRMDLSDAEVTAAVEHMLAQ
ncbi:MAG: c-type cytochrome [Xanthomonadales bacterium]|jgi:cytochrome c5|nr:c-type cytochrome [Xanthomonadales bacterium]